MGWRLKLLPSQQDGCAPYVRSLLEITQTWLCRVLAKTPVDNECSPNAPSDMPSPASPHSPGTMPCLSETFASLPEDRAALEKYLERKARKQNKRAENIASGVQTYGRQCASISKGSNCIYRTLPFKAATPLLRRHTFDSPPEGSKDDDAGQLDTRTQGVKFKWKRRLSFNPMCPPESLMGSATSAKRLANNSTFMSCSSTGSTCADHTSSDCECKLNSADQFDCLGSDQCLPSVQTRAWFISDHACFELPPAEASNRSSISEQWKMSEGARIESKHRSWVVGM
jgi:hypothetical protein